MSESNASTAAISTHLEPALYQCGSCHRSYKRLDHLARHVRSHTRSRPYECHLCPKAFGRADLLKRHIVGHGGQVEAGQSDRNGQARPESSGRVSKACKSCASNHLRCTDEKPCQRCKKRGIPCEWSKQMSWTPTESEASRQSIGTDPVAEPVSTTLGSFKNFDPSLYGPNSHQGVEKWKDAAEPQGSLPIAESTTHALNAPVFERIVQNITVTSAAHPQPFALSGPPVDPLILDLDSPFRPMDIFSGMRGSENIFGLDDSINIDFDEMDLQFLDTYNEVTPFEFSTASMASPSRQPNLPEDIYQTPNRPVPASGETLGSFWRFRPNVLDNRSAEEHNLTLPSSASNATSPESLVSVSSRITCTELRVSMRDEILAVIMQSCRNGSFRKAVASFPSIELLDSLLQYYLSSPVVRAGSFLHVASLNPNQKRPELVAAMVAAGAVLTSDPTLTKLGLAMQECLRQAIAEHWERNNVLIRDLELSQAFLICLEVAIWSGFSRKVEIAESFLQPIVTMLRRNNRFKRLGYEDIFLTEDDEGESLQNTWLRWAHRESFKRLAFRMHTYDANISIAQMVSPLVSYAEMTLPLPDSSELWSASSAQEWKEGYLARSTSGSFFITDYFNDPHIVSSHGHSLDIAVGNFAYLSCLWAMSWEIMQLTSFQGLTSKCWNSLIAKSRRDEILRLLDLFKLTLDFNNNQYFQETMMRVETICLHLHMSLEDLQNFAGMEGLDQAAAVRPTVLAWAKSETGRRAVWHAGQIALAASLSPKTTIQGPLALMLYHATMVLWVYGLLAESPDETNGSGRPWPPPIPGDGEDIWLDGQDGIALQRFIQYGRGRPCIHGFSAHGIQGDKIARVDLSQTDNVIKTITEVLNQNFAGGETPFLIKKLTRLIHELPRYSRRQTA